MTGPRRGTTDSPPEGRGCLGDHGGDEVTGVIDWSGASPGDAFYDLAVLTLGHPEHLGEVIAGYDGDVDRDLVRAWWSWRCLVAVRWLAEHGFGELDALPEVAVLRSHR